MRTGSALLVLLSAGGSESDDALRLLVLRPLTGAAADALSAMSSAFR